MIVHFPPLATFLFQTAFSTTQSAFDNTGSTYTICTKIPANYFSLSGGTIRLTIGETATQTTSTILTNVFIGTAAGTYSYSGDQVEVLFSGASGTTIPIGGTSTSDSVTFAYDSTKAVVVAFNISQGSSYATPPTSTGTIIGYAKSGASEAGTTTKGPNYQGKSGRCYLLSKIEIAP